MPPVPENSSIVAVCAAEVRRRLLNMPGVKEVDISNVLHAVTTVKTDSEQQVRAFIYEEEQRLIDAYPGIEFDFNVRRE